MKVGYYDGEFMDGEEMTVSYRDRAVYFGDGVYEVIRIYDGGFYTLDEHIDRLLYSAEEIDIGPLDRNEIRYIVEELKERNVIVNGALYIQVSRGMAIREHGYPKGVKPVVMAYIDEATRPVAQMKNGVNTITSNDYRWLKCHVKSLNLLANVMEKQRAVDAGAKETILHRDGVVTEGSSTNVFIIKSGVLYTHPADNLILNGITRQEVMKLSHHMDLDVRTEAFTVEELYAAKEVFYTSTTQEITPVLSVDGHKISDGEIGGYTLELQRLFDMEVQNLHSVK